LQENQGSIRGRDEVKSFPDPCIESLKTLVGDRRQQTQGAEATEPGSGTSDDDKMAGLQQLGRLLPSGDIQKRVQSDQKKQFGRWSEIILQHSDGIDRIGGRRSADFNVGHSKPRLPGNGFADHRKAMVGRGQRLGMFVGRGARRNKKNRLQVKSFSDLPGQGKMAAVNGVEGPPEEAEFHERMKAER
jgi:hypothetical protein